MTDDILHRLRHVFDDTDEVLEWIDTSTYDGAETYDHVSGMHKTMLDAADRIEKLEKALKFYAEATPDYLHGADWDWDCGEKKYGVMARHTLEDK